MRSSPCERARFSASSVGMTPSWVPSSSITRTVRMRIWSLTRSGRAMGFYSYKKQKNGMPKHLRSSRTRADGFLRLRPDRREASGESLSALLRPADHTTTRGPLSPGRVAPLKILPARDRRAERKSYRRFTTPKPSEWVLKHGKSTWLTCASGMRLLVGGSVGDCLTRWSPPPDIIANTSSRCWAAPSRRRGDGGAGGRASVPKSGPYWARSGSVLVTPGRFG